ncbi:MAG: methyltransferase, TIGR04325 family [Chloroflexi bacterium]|nr:methyltransferase, TIGR04325 family [Chloroflexota bacterium]
MTAKEIIKLLTPPLLIKFGKRLLPLAQNRQLSEWEYIPEGWAYARNHPEVKGWNVSAILETYKSKWERFLEMTQGTEPLGVAHESYQTTRADIASHNTIMSFAYALALAAHKRDEISVLDWGGGIGHYYILAKELLPDVKIDYHCKDLSLLSGYGATLFPDQHFYNDDSCFERSYNLVLASGALHYVEDWQNVMENLAKVTSRYLFVTRLPTTLISPSYVFIQRPYTFGYDTEYLAWCFNRRDFLQELDRLGLILIREFAISEPIQIANAPDVCQFRGYFFRR